MLQAAVTAAAAVFKPLMLNPSFMMTPAPKNPIIDLGLISHRDYCWPWILRSRHIANRTLRIVDDLGIEA
jgi:hypothetical protein